MKSLLLRSSLIQPSKYPLLIGIPYKEKGCQDHSLPMISIGLALSLASAYRITFRAYLPSYRNKNKETLF